METYKTLLYSKTINEDMKKLLEEKEGIFNTGLFFESRYKDPVKVKAHITLPAMKNIKNILIEKYGEQKAKEYMKTFFEIILDLNKSNTALLSLYIPKTYFSRKIREEI